MKALGLIETKGLVGAIVAADIALKTAQVELINREHTKGGLVCIEFEGDVAAVKASVEAAVTAIKDMGIYVGSHVIPRPDDSVEKIIKRKKYDIIIDIMSTPKASNCLAILSFSLALRLTLGVCSPSLNVVSNIFIHLSNHFCF